jgi:hypothetical protein
MMGTKRGLSGSVVAFSMSRLSPNQLTVRKIESLKSGAHCDGGNLWITVTEKSRLWSIRFKSPVTGKRREMGIGPARDVPLAKARAAADAARQLIRDGVDPIEHRKKVRADNLPPVIRTFKEVADKYAAEQTPG